MPSQAKMPSHIIIVVVTVKQAHDSRDGGGEAVLCERPRNRESQAYLFNAGHHIAANSKYDPLVDAIFRGAFAGEYKVSEIASSLTDSGARHKLVQAFS